ncbi:MAG: hypothetical protein AAGJ08_07400 [Cyanobacteria bacterium P01_H01_bin.35]
MCFTKVIYKFAIELYTYFSLGCLDTPQKLQIFWLSTTSIYFLLPYCFAGVRQLLIFSPVVKHQLLVKKHKDLRKLFSWVYLN